MKGDEQLPDDVIERLRFTNIGEGDDLALQLLRAVQRKGCKAVNELRLARRLMEIIHSPGAGVRTVEDLVAVLDGPNQEILNSGTPTTMGSMWKVHMTAMGRAYRHKVETIAGGIVRALLEGKIEDPNVLQTIAGYSCDHALGNLDAVFVTAVSTFLNGKDVPGAQHRTARNHMYEDLLNELRDRGVQEESLKPPVVGARPAAPMSRSSLEVLKELGVTS
jgi:hypothetical protein